MRRVDASQTAIIILSGPRVCSLLNGGLVHESLSGGPSMPEVRARVSNSKPQETDLQIHSGFHAWRWLRFPGEL